ncbi:AAA family ATPase [Anaerotruncus colihominis]|uniref:AAA family ATPase n=1 Tax=Anaerotruncus colihominis TaxID=169435 RepID=UPI00242E2CDD|nr:AAA family ATPase [Anaerotruncus colihominis]
MKRRGAAAGFDEASDRRGTVNTGATAPDGLFIREISVKAGADGGYAMELPAVRRLGKLVLTAPVTFFVGENGSGKSTILEAIAIACGFNPEGGTRNFCFKTSDSHASLWQALHIVRGARRPGDGFFLRAESFYNVATKIDELDRETPFGPRLIDSYGGRSMHAQSHGESFLSLVVNRFGGQGLYLLDEPEAALSVTGQLALLARLRILVQNGSQFIIASHSPVLTAYPDAAIYQFSHAGVERVSYSDTDAYVLTRQFLNNPGQMLRELFEK